jgi:hypothetical protein
MVLSMLLLVMWAGAIVSITDFSRPREGSLRVDVGPLEWTLQRVKPTK